MAEQENNPEIEVIGEVIIPRVFIPPGRTVDMQTWNKQDVLRWIACFLPPHIYPNVFIPLKNLEVDGAVLMSIIKRRPSHITFGVPEKEFLLIISYGETVLKSQ